MLRTKYSTTFPTNLLPPTSWINTEAAVSFIKFCCISHEIINEFTYMCVWL
jgi:hypothetical protein